jgi:hypothetical protein
MLRIVHIQTLDNYHLAGTFNKGIKKQLNILPLVEEQKHLKGVEKLLDRTLFSTARIGIFGEIVWDNIIEITSPDGETTIWDYDISPEFFFVNGK